MMRALHRIVGLALASVFVLLATTGLLLHYPGATRRLLGEPMLPGPLADPTTALAVDPGARAHLLLGTRRGIFESTDAGASWRDVRFQVPAENVVAIAFASRVPDLVLVALANGGVFVSSDGGRLWDDAGLPLRTERVQSATFSAGADIVVRTTKGLYVGCAGGGWQRLDHGPRGPASRLRYVEALHGGTWPGKAVGVVEDAAAVGLLIVVVTGFAMTMRRGERRRS